MNSTVTLQSVFELAERLSPVDKVRLIERIAPLLESEFDSHAGGPRESLRGLWKGLQVGDDDIAEARREMWSGFPREEPA